MNGAFICSFQKPHKPVCACLLMDYLQTFINHCFINNDVIRSPLRMIPLLIVIGNPGTIQVSDSHKKMMDPFNTKVSTCIIECGMLWKT